MTVSKIIIKNKESLFSILIPLLCLQSSLYLLNLSLTCYLFLCLLPFELQQPLLCLFTARVELLRVIVSPECKSALCVWNSCPTPTPQGSKTNGLSRSLVHEDILFLASIRFPHLLLLYISPKHILNKPHAQLVSPCVLSPSIFNLQYASFISPSQHSCLPLCSAWRTTALRTFLVTFICFPQTNQKYQCPL